MLASVQSAQARRARTGRASSTWRSATTRAPEVVFFNQPWRASSSTPGTEAVFFGRVTDFRGTRQMTNPVVDLVAGTPDRTLRIVPIYPAVGEGGPASAGRWASAWRRR